MNIACIGVGNMGGAVARRLAGGDFGVTVFDPNPAAVARCAESGAQPAGSVAEAVQQAEVVLTSLPTTSLVSETVDLLAELLKPDSVVVDISTTDAATARSAADRCTDAGLHFIACPLGKTPAHAEEGAIPLFVGGEAEIIARISALLDRMGEKTYNFGTVEAATTFKLVSNLIGMANVAVLAEGLAIAQRAGIAADIFTEALKDTGAASFQESVRLPWMIDHDWAPRFGVDLALKDVGLAVQSAQQWGVPVPVGTASLDQLAAASSRGYGAEDVVALAKLVVPAPD